MQHNYYVRQNEPEHQPLTNHTHEVRHRNGYGATVTTRHYTPSDAEVERRYRAAHGWTVEVVLVNEAL